MTIKTSDTARFKVKQFDYRSFFFTGLTGLASGLIIAILAVILLIVIYNGWSTLSWHFVTSRAVGDKFDRVHAAVMPNIVGTSARVILMTLFVIPIGVITAIYLNEYAHKSSRVTHVIRGAVNNLAGVPSVVFGLFGLGFFIDFVGKNADRWMTPNDPLPVWGKPSIIWAALTLAVMTMPVVIVATEESLRAIPNGLREASLALGATKLQTILRIVIPNALPGILTGGILAVSRASGEVAPILLTGVIFSMPDLPNSLHSQFMDLGYMIFHLSTQAANPEENKPGLYATVLVLLMLTFALNVVAILIRSRMRKKLRNI